MTTTTPAAPLPLRGRRTRPAGAPLCGAPPPPLAPPLRRRPHRLTRRRERRRLTHAPSPLTTHRPTQVPPRRRCTAHTAAPRRSDHAPSRSAARPVADAQSGLASAPARRSALATSSFAARRAAAVQSDPVLLTPATTSFRYRCRLRLRRHRRRLWEPNAAPSEHSRRTTSRPPSALAPRPPSPRPARPTPQSSTARFIRPPGLVAYPIDGLRPSADGIATSP